MAVEAVGSPRGGAGRVPGTEAVSSTGFCSLEILSRAITTLLNCPVSARQVRDKAVGLGLLRQPENDTFPALSCQAASRLLLAGYRLPAQVESGTLQALQEYLRQGPLVLVPLAGLRPGDDVGGPVLFQLHGLHAQDPDEPWLEVGEPEASVAPSAPIPLPRSGGEGSKQSSPFLEGGAGLRVKERLPLARFEAAWAAADRLLFTAARRWDDLPREGTSFFGGARDPDGHYHWHLAEYLTDGQGRILRC
ncbi:MAG TPA: hypothetical protein VNK04_11980 [Gemmataceae bacterium]|nr:hypothetical protein [Gemmataceae bacterium]